MTRLLNRALLLARWRSAISNAKRHGKSVALLFLDLNGSSKSTMHSVAPQRT